MAWTHKAFFRAFLEQLSLPVTTQGLRALAAVSIYESSGGDERWYNPLACTQDWKDATNYNAAGVKRYRTFADGVEASAELFAGPHWDEVRAAFQTATGRTEILNAFEKAYTWVSNPYFGYSTGQCDDRLAHTLH